MTETRKGRQSQAERRHGSESRLLEAAVKVISRAGVGAVTFETLGQASGFSRGLVTKRFGSKDAMLDAVLLHLHGSQQRTIEEQGYDAMSGLDAVLAYTDQGLRNLASTDEARAYFLLLSASVADLNARRSICRDTHAAVRDQLAGWIERGQREGDIRTEVDAGSAALLIGCILFGASMQMLVNPATDIDPMCGTGLLMLRRLLATESDKGAVEP